MRSRDPARVLARALLEAEKLVNDGRLSQAVEQRYAGWQAPLGKDILLGRVDLDGLADHVLARNQDVEPVSGRQEYLENLVNAIL